MAAAAVACALLAPGLPAAGDSHVQSLVPACDGLTEPVGFTDVAGLPVATQDAINCAYYYEITYGKVDGEVYAPLESVTRYQMALFISRSIDYVELAGDIDVVDAADAPDAGFTDLTAVPAEARDAIERLAALGIVNGRTATSYEPFAVVNRRDMARFLARVQAQVVAPAYPEAAYDPADRTTAFDDVPDSAPGADEIYALQAAGLVQGYGAGRYEPFLPVRRDHMALYLMRHLADNVQAGVLYTLADNEAPTGFAGTVGVDYVLKDIRLLITPELYFLYDENDTFAVGEVPVPLAEFEAALSSGDAVAVTGYQRNPDASSGFVLQDLNPQPPAVSAATGTEPGGQDDVTVTVTPPDELWTSVLIERAGADGVFNPLVTLTWDDVDDAGAVSYRDLDRAAGTYGYRARVENYGDPGGWSDVVAVTVPAPAG